VGNLTSDRPTPSSRCDATAMLCSWLRGELDATADLVGAGGRSPHMPGAARPATRGPGLTMDDQAMFRRVAEDVIAATQGFEAVGGSRQRR
jgi:hypothetical protein